MTPARTAPARIDMAVRQVRTSVYRVPTPEPEADGTLAWDATTLVLVEVEAGGLTGIGWSYTAAAAAALVEELLAPVVMGRDAFDIPGSWRAMIDKVRNVGRPGLVSMAVAAVDIALWDLKAKALDSPLAVLLGRVREQVPVYGSGGFTSYDDATLVAQLEGWLGDGIGQVKIKIGESRGAAEGRDLARAELARSVIGDGIELFVDANGGYTRGQAVRMGRRLDDLDVRWFEEPVSSDDLTGLAAVRAAVGADVTAGEYADSVGYATRMCAAGAVDCLQLDVTRTAGITEFLRCAAVAAGQGLDVSTHCAPTLHAPLLAALPNGRHAEWFSDHVRVESLLFDGAPSVAGGMLPADAGRPGLGVSLRASDAADYRVG